VSPSTKIVTVFGSSLPKEDSGIYWQVRQLGSSLARSGFAVCNGGYAGLMEASARGARDAGGYTVGITCELWPRAANPWIIEEVRTRSFSERIMTLIERGDAYLVLPGGTGTLAELAIAWEIMNKSALARTVGGRKPLLVLAPYWQPVIDCLLQETQLASSHDAARPDALENISLISDLGAAAEILRTRLFEN
jgi:uncharacterized protein (TIGR00725 family)